MSIDYVTGWYVKASILIENTNIKAAFVSTNSITQGEQPPILWAELNRHNVHIDFAYRTFKWESEAKEKAAVHCVIIGFSTMQTQQEKRLFDGSAIPKLVENINPYLFSAPSVLIASRSKPLCNVQEIVTGNQATDDGNFYLTPAEYVDFIKKEPTASPYIHVAYNSQGFINNKPMYCIWLKGVSPAEIKRMPLIYERVSKVREYRLKSPKAATRAQADIPTVFTEIRQPEGNYIVIPKVSSENRRYVPMGFLSPEIICNNTIKFVPNASLYEFGVLISNVHMAWMRAVAGRLEMRYQYSNTIVYNNFPWPTPTEAQKAQIEKTAQAILDARSLYPDASLADLYDELTMPPELRTAHQNNDRAVMRAYGFDIATTTEASCVAELMKMYRQLTDSENTATPVADS